MKKTRLLLLLALLMTAATGAWAQGPVDGTIAWSVGNEASATVSASIKDAISSTGVTTGSGLTVSTCKYFDTNMMKYQPATANAGNVSGVMIEYTIEAVDGYKFKPTGVEYAAVKDGTDNASYSWSYTIDGVESAITDVSMNDVLRSSGSNSATAQLMHSESITADGCSVFTLRFYISNCSNTKKICIGNITISGSVSAATSAGYTVSLKDGVKDAGKWTVKAGTDGSFQSLPLKGVKAGTKVKLKYDGDRSMLKGVKATSEAAAAKEPATVTTAPTGAAIVGVGKTTALVSGGVADGGTLMYQMTTTNTMPTSTAGFSASVPTAQTITASGEVYVWYFVKADGTHTDSEIAATAIEVPVADIVWDVTNISDLMVQGTEQWYVKEDVTLCGNAEMIYAMWYDYGDPTHDGIVFNTNESGGYTFVAPTGKAFTKIEMKALGDGGWHNANLGTGWAFNVDMEKQIFTVTWKGSAAASTVDLLTGVDDFGGETISYIAFTLVDAE